MVDDDRPKHIRSGGRQAISPAYLITYGLEDWSLGPWHSDVDYYRWAAGSQHDFRFEPEDACCDAYATAFNGWFVTNRVEMKCPSFNGRTAGVRAGTMLHESTHIIYGDAFGVWSHQSNPPGSNCSSDCSDDWYFHYFAFGDSSILPSKYGAGRHRHGTIVAPGGAVAIVRPP